MLKPSIGSSKQELAHDETVETPRKLRIEVIASGLDNPCRLTFDVDGVLYVAEAGRGETGTGIFSLSIPSAALLYGVTGTRI